MKYFVTGTGTDIGKTYVTSLLLKQNPGSKAIKPIITGGTGDLEILGCEALYKFERAASPDIASDGKIDFGKVVEYCRKVDCNFIEGAGGVMTPINFEKTYLDLIEELKTPVILVIGNYLGTISHTLTAYELLKARNIQIAAIILNESHLNASDLSEIRKSIARFVDADIIILKRNQDKIDAKLI